MKNNFSKNLKKIRKDNNLSQEQLAEELGVSRQAISKWESSITYPEMDKIIALCTKFNINIDDLLYKDIKEIKDEETTKKNLNKFLDSFLKFVTNAINMFSNMTFKSKIKCLLEQIVISLILLCLFFLVGKVSKDILSRIFGMIPSNIYSVLSSIIIFIYFIFSLSFSLMILLHIFKTRYLDYYEKIRVHVLEDNNVTDHKNTDNVIETNKVDKEGKNENKIIIRDPKHSKYKFIHGIFKVIIIFAKFFVLCFSVTLFLILICLFISFVFSFLIVKTGIFFVGLLLTISSSAIINIILILILLNFVFNRKNDKKKMIWSFIISLITLGIGIGSVFIGILNFEYIENNKDVLKIDYIELDMKNNLVIDNYHKLEYVEADNSNIKIEYKINKYCNIDYSGLYNSSSPILYLWGSCENPIKLVKEVVNDLNNKKITLMDNELYDIKIYTTKENIEVLKKNYSEYTNKQKEESNIIDSYEKRIDELENIVDKYIEKEREYKDKINELMEK